MGVMGTFASPGAVSLVERFVQRAERHGERVAIRTLDGATVTWSAWERESRLVAAALVARGHAPGTRVAILAGNRPLWPIADLGALLAAQVSVGLYPTSAPAQVEQQLGDCGATLVVVDTWEQLAKVRQVRERLPALRTVVHLCETESGAGELSWRGFLDQGIEAMARHDVRATLAARLRDAKPEDDAILIYTSGSTGTPKGARLSHRYLAASAESIADALGLREDDTQLSFLPFCHAAERVFGLYTRIHCGMEVGMVEEPGLVWAAARAFDPTVFGGLPRFFERVYEALQAEREGASGEYAERWRRALELGGRRSQLRRRGAPVPAELEREWAEAAAFAKPLLEGFFGTRMRLVTSGGAALPVEVAEFLDALGVTVLGAYGQTEHLCVAFHRPARYAFDSVGVPMRGTSLRFAEDGELLVKRNGLTFSGYFGRDAETRAAFTGDGEWLLTGDLGAMDDDGFLRIVGRKKELIALSTGKKVAPLPIEATLTSHPWIAQAVVVGEGRKHVAALLTLRRAIVERWAAEGGIALPWAELLRDARVTARVQRAVDDVNAALSRTEQVRKWVLLEDELSTETGELTPTLKVQRAVVAQRHAARIDALYS